MAVEPSWKELLERRIDELKAARQRLLEQANAMLERLNGAIDELERLLQTETEIARQH